MCLNEMNFKRDSFKFWVKSNEGEYQLQYLAQDGMQVFKKPANKFKLH